jgi:hypothetical protein
MVVFAGRYNDHNAWQIAAKISSDILAPVLVEE